jgi:transcriptional regulator of aromatic amino acid metabolism
MIRRCAWCDTTLPSPDHEPGDARVTHTICDRCRDNLEFQNGVSLDRYLDGMEVPVLAVDGAGAVRYANRVACTVVGKDACDIVGHLGGDVMECAFARLPGGCGMTEHCSGCTIRRSVMSTYITGTSVLRRLAHLYHEIAPEDVMLVTTRKVGDVVLLRIDPAPAPTCAAESGAL